MQYIPTPSYALIVSIEAFWVHHSTQDIVWPARPLSPPSPGYRIGEGDLEWV